MPSASHGNADGKGPPARLVKSSGWVDDPNASPIHLKAQRVKKEPPIPVPRVAYPKGNAPLLSVGGEWALKECEASLAERLNVWQHLKTTLKSNNMKFFSMGCHFRVKLALCTFQ
jgi:hypothetical protein